MTVLTTDAWELALAGFMAILVSHTTFTLALQVSTVSAQGCALAVVLSALALGIGLWSTSFVQILSLWMPEQPTVGATWFVLPFAVAPSSHACALLILACSQPNALGMVGSAFAFAAGIMATHCAVLDELPGQAVLQEGAAWLCGSFVVAFAGFLTALSVWYRCRDDQSWAARSLRLLVSVGAAIGILGANAQAWIGSPLVVSACCSAPTSTVRLFAIAAA